MFSIFIELGIIYSISSFTNPEKKERYNPMISLSQIRCNTIFLSNDNNFDELFENFTMRKHKHGGFEYNTHGEYIIFHSLEIKKCFDEFFMFLKEIVTIEAIGMNEKIIIRDFHALAHAHQSILRSVLNKRVFILLTNKHSLINRGVLSYFVILRVKASNVRPNYLRDTLFKKFIECLKSTDIGVKKEVCYQLQQSSLDINMFFRDIFSHIICNRVVTLSVKGNIIKIFEEYERYYRKSYKDLIALEGLLIGISYELKDFIHCL